MIALTIYLACFLVMLVSIGGLMFGVSDKYTARCVGLFAGAFAVNMAILVASWLNWVH